MTEPEGNTLQRFRQRNCIYKKKCEYEGQKERVREWESGAERECLSASCKTFDVVGNFSSARDACGKKPNNRKQGIPLNYKLCKTKSL